MTNDCTLFLQWALPRMRMRWTGFRKVRKQVCKRIRRRMTTLDLDSYEQYQHWLETHPSEWSVLDEMCRIVISRFYRDWAVFDYLKNVLLPELARTAMSEERPIRCWSAGCASGEEPYTLSLIWHFVLKEKFPGLDFEIIATDIDMHLLDRARAGCYRAGSIKALPKTWLAKAFSLKDDTYCIYPTFKKNIEWICQDIRKTLPEGKFDLILCRNLVATYFQSQLQLNIFNQFKDLLQPKGILVLGCHEKLPEGLDGFFTKEKKLMVFKRGSNVED